MKKSHLNLSELLIKVQSKVFLRNRKPDHPDQVNVMELRAF